MHGVRAMALGLVLWAVPAAAGPRYVDSAGGLRELHLAPDRVAIAPTRDSRRDLHLRPEVDASAPVVLYPGGLYEMRLQAEFYGRQDEVARRLVAARVAERAGMVFAAPPGLPPFALDRQVIVMLRRSQAPDGLFAELGLIPVGALGDDGRLFVGQAADADGAMRTALAAAGNAQVAWALPDFIVPVTLHGRPNDPYYDAQWHHEQAGGDHISSAAAWDITHGDPQVVVAVIDTGLDQTHPDLEASRLVTGYNAQTGSSDPSPLSGTLDAHGTCCSGLIAATSDNQEGIAGICPRCSLMGIKMMDAAATMTQISNGYRAIEHATEHGAWVISNSWGIEEAYMDQIDIQPFYAAVRDAVANGRNGLGAVVLFASGNGSQFTGQGEPIGANELQNMAEVMAVGGTGPDGQVVGYSDYGPNLSVVAPTGKIDLSNPFERFDGPQIFTTDTTGDQGFSRGGTYYEPGFFGDRPTQFDEADATGNYTRYFNGTSAACPIAAGVVALVFSANPALTGAQARRVVEQTADRIGTDAHYDPGGHDDHYGYGRVNAARAVRAARAGFDNPDQAACSEDFNCAGGRCLKASAQDPEGICVTLCTSDPDCGSGRKCVLHSSGLRICLPACDDHEDCAAGMVCLDGTCAQVICRTGNECPVGAACATIGGACEKGCTSDETCVSPALCFPVFGGNLCFTVACLDGTECPTMTACPLGGGNCQRICAGDVDCVPPTLCLPAGNGTLCRAVSCSGDQDCPEGLVCGPAGQCTRRPIQPDGGDGGDDGIDPGEAGGCGCGESNPGGIALAVFLLWGCWRRRSC